MNKSSHETFKPYGITEKKKAELDKLTIDVQNTEYEVELLQVNVNSLTEKDNEFAGFLNVAETNLQTALNNKNLVNEVVNSAVNLKKNSKIAETQTGDASKKIQKVTKNMTAVVNQLIFAAEVINKLASMINRKKALNPLISDDLITRVTNAGNDANNAVALSLTAMKSCYASMNTGAESFAISQLEADQADFLLKTLTGKEKAGDPISNTSIQGILLQAYDTAKENSSKALWAKQETTRQLNQAQKELTATTNKLNSLKAGLAAANAAALAA